MTMCLSVKITGLLAVSFWFCSNFFVSGGRPRCKGDPLQLKEFSKTDEVGFVRDLLVDVLARNVFNLLNYPVPSICEELANMRTSTCLPKCSKWKRTSCWNKLAINRIMIKAEEMVKHFNTVVCHRASYSIDDEKVILDHIKDVEYRLVQSGAAREDSKIMEELDTMKNKFCHRYLLYEEERKKVEKKEIRIKNISGNEDVSNAIDLFIHDFEAKNEVEISNHHVEDNVVRPGDNMMSGIIRLNFEYKKSPRSSAMSTSVILKFPSLFASFDIMKEANMFNREALFYTTVLPELYKLGECVPFAPILHIATPSGALVLEDLTVRGYIPGDRIKQLDYDETLMALIALANYHALGYKYLKTLSKNDPSMSLIAANQPSLMALTNKTKKEYFNKFCEMVKHDLRPSLYQKILKLEDEILAEPIKEMDDEEPEVNLEEDPEKDPKKKRMTVIMHGDCQPDNILIQYHKFGTPAQVKLIDWQSSRIGSPIVDLIYFFVTSVRIEVFERNDSTFWFQYDYYLNEKLKALQITPFDNLHEHRNDYKYYYLNVLSTHWQEIMRAGQLSEVTDFYKSLAMKWLAYLEKEEII